MPFEDVVGKAVTVLPEQMLIELPKPKAGMVFWLTVTEKLAVVAHWPAVGVNV